MLIGAHQLRHHLECVPELVNVDIATLGYKKEEKQM